MGLYQRAAGIRKAPPPAPEPAERLLADIRALPAGIEAPGHLFGLFQGAFRLTRSALLLYDPLRMVFAPWAGTGFDETTMHRLRIPLGFNQFLNRTANGEIITLHAEGELAEFARFFSAREFAGLSGLTFAPLIHEGKLAALLLITQTETGAGLQSPAAALLAEACLLAAPLIHNAREQKLERMAAAGAPEPPESVQVTIRALEAECRRTGMPLLMVRLSLAHAVELILQKNSFVDDFRLQEDLARIIASLLADIGRVFRLGPARLLLAVTRMPDPDPGLLLSHLTLSLKGFFLELEGESDVRYAEQVKVWPADGAEAAGLARALL